MGGVTDKSELFISPTVMTEVTHDDAVMQQEIFGPIMPIIDVADADEAVRIINEGEKPLALYCYTNNATTKEKYDKYLIVSIGQRFPLFHCLIF